ncbi:23S rRNA (adenine(2030)-N(6))-methyltransferase RlmJ [Saezia sanguinis]|uniref:23S rRNA (adenine(2030)-N(6))-methyltransferase RlmJ n=1 Tax=Saezia sanguinis TaxID=1965230 RepID=UPI003054E878
MFSYRHGFHAGNHADVLKHVVLLQTLKYLFSKDTALLVVDTHAGTGLYQLDDEFAQKSMEAQDGIARLWDAPQLPAALADYVQEIRAFNPAGPLQTYPGSPMLIWNNLRAQDQLQLFELHPTDQRLLQSNVRQLEHNRQVKVNIADGFAGLKSLLPPPSRRGLILMDPSYEVKSDYQRVHECMADALKRFATGVYLIWYPIVPQPLAHQLPGKLRRLAETHGRGWLHTTLKVRNPSSEGRGMVASGMFVINPPFILQSKLKEALPVLMKYLAQDKGAHYTLDVQDGK